MVRVIKLESDCVKGEIKTVVLKNVPVGAARDFIAKKPVKRFIRYYIEIL